MKEIQLPEDIKLLLVKAKSFPDAVVQAYQELERAIVQPAGRSFYGISRGSEDGGVLYWAGVRPLGDEERTLGLEQFTVRRGTYVAETLSNWRGKEHILGETFRKLYSDPRVDPMGSCVEWYRDNGDVTCMVRIISSTR
jgi:hypothetical protein